LRLVSGRFRGRTLVAPQNSATRPTADRARQALFDVLAHAAWAPEFDGARILDLFAGSGALGFEALSRGAAFALFVENDEQARAAIRENVEALHLYGETRVHRRDATDLGPRPASAGAPFDLAFLDPPYRLGLGEKAMADMVSGRWLRPGAVVVFERAADEPEPISPGFERLDDRTWGAARIWFFRLNTVGSATPR